MLKQAINKAYQGTTNLLQNKNNIKLQNNEKNNIISHMLNVSTDIQSFR